MPLISVLMPCWNAAATLPEALDSLRCQTLAAFEIVAIDDGSSDATRRILNDYAAEDRRLRLISQEHTGIVGALEAGLQACRGAYIARMDADDRSHPERLALQAAYLDAHPQTDVIGCRVTAFPPQNVRPGFAIYLDWLNQLISDADIRREIFVESPLPHPSWMLRRQALSSVGGYQDCGWAEDYDLLLRLYLAGKRFAKLEETLLDWRESPNRLTFTDNRYSLENFLRLKTHYLVRGPLTGRDAVIVWGAGMVGRRLGKQLQRLNAPLSAYVDIDPMKIGRTRRGLPILPPEALREHWSRFEHPLILAAVGARGARPLVRARLEGLDFCEGRDWLSAA